MTTPAHELQNPLQYDTTLLPQMQITYTHYYRILMFSNITL